MNRAFYKAAGTSEESILRHVAARMNKKNPETTRWYDS